MTAEFMIQLLVGFSMVMALAFIFFYGTEPVPGKWYRKPSLNFTETRLGIILMVQKFNLFIVLGLILAARTFSDYPGRELVTIVVYSSVAVATTMLLHELRSIQKKYERPKHGSTAHKSRRKNERRIK